MKPYFEEQYFHFPSQRLKVSSRYLTYIYFEAPKSLFKQRIPRNPLTRATISGANWNKRDEETSPHPERNFEQKQIAIALTDANSLFVYPEN